MSFCITTANSELSTDHPVAASSRKGGRPAAIAALHPWRSSGSSERLSKPGIKPEPRLLTPPLIDFSQGEVNVVGDEPEQKIDKDKVLPTVSDSFSFRKKRVRKVQELPYPTSPQLISPSRNPVNAITQLLMPYLSPKNVDPPLPSWRLEKHVDLSGNEVNSDSSAASRLGAPFQLKSEAEERHSVVRQTRASAEAKETLEDQEIAEGDVTRWRTPDYALRADELDNICRMINSVAHTLNRPVVIVSGWRCRAFADRIRKLATTGNAVVTRPRAVSNVPKS